MAPFRRRTVQTITMCTGLQPGVEIEIFNASGFPVTILPSVAVAGQYIAGTIQSVSDMTKIANKGAAVIKVWRTGSTTVAPTIMLIGSLVA